MFTILRAFCGFFFIIAILKSAFSIVDIVRVIFVENSLIFGTEVNGWVYSSKTTFLIANSIVVVNILVAIYFYLYINDNRIKLVGIFLISIIITFAL